jgi:hypothetical protein
MTGETAQQIFDESAKLSEVTNPATGSTAPKDTTRSVDAVRADKNTQKDIVNRYENQIKIENNGRLPLDCRPLDQLHYKEAHFISELRYAQLKGNV